MISAPASSRSEQPGQPLPDYDPLRKTPWAAACITLQSNLDIGTLLGYELMHAVVCGFA